jgi:TolB protein
VKELYVMDADGDNLRQLTRDNSLAATPCWGMNGTEVYYTSYKDTNPDLWGIQIATRKTWVISRFAGLNYTADWSAANKRIALTLGKDGNSEIYTMDRNGNTATMKRLTRNACIDSSPCWNPAGTQMVFTSDRTGTPQIWAMDADGNNARKLTYGGNYNDAAVWSPKGDQIAYVGRDGQFDVHVMNVDGTNDFKLTSNQRNNEDPTYAPDSKHFVFSSNRTGSYEIFIMDDKGNNVHQLTKMNGNAQSPSWSPLFR